MKRRATSKGEINAVAKEEHAWADAPPQTGNEGNKRPNQQSSVTISKQTNQRTAHSCARLGGVPSGRLERGGGARPFGAHLELVRAHRICEVVARVLNLRLQRVHGLLKLGAQRLVGALALNAISRSTTRRSAALCLMQERLALYVPPAYRQWRSAWRGRQLALAGLLRGRQVQRHLLWVR